MAHVITFDAMGNDDQREYVLKAALDGLKSWKKRYGTLSEFSGVTKAIDEVLPKAKKKAA
jgi:fatty acid/phospholipid biosynthesis enzyme